MHPEAVDGRHEEPQLNGTRSQSSEEIFGRFQVIRCRVGARSQASRKGYVAGAIIQNKIVGSPSGSFYQSTLEMSRDGFVKVIHWHACRSVRRVVVPAVC